jgi:alanine-synthesizing transaminase
MRARYKSRRDVLIEGLRTAGWAVDPPAGSMFAWAPIPERFQHLGSLDFSKLLLTEANVAVAPGTGFGEQGDGYVRFALVENEARTRQAIRSIKAFLKNADAKAPAPGDSKTIDLNKIRAARG